MHRAARKEYTDKVTAEEEIKEEDTLYLLLCFLLLSLVLACCARAHQ